MTDRSDTALHAIRDVVAIDGPSGAGKSTVARMLARELSLRYLDTGAMYRAVTWFLLSRDLSDLQEEVVAEVLEQLELQVDAAGCVRVNGEDVSSHLRSQEVESRVSQVSAIGAVRRRMRYLQRAVAAAAPIVAEGRDMGSVVFPKARWKFYLDAQPEERARRRRGDFLAAGRDVSQSEVQEEMAVRDRLDSSRPDGPLTQTDDAVYCDTTGQTIEQVVAMLAEAVRRSSVGDAR